VRDAVAGEASEVFGFQPVLVPKFHPIWPARRELAEKPVQVSDEFRPMFVIR
jgi:hypothetical protein